MNNKEKEIDLKLEEDNIKSLEEEKNTKKKQSKETSSEETSQSNLKEAIDSALNQPYSKPSFSTVRLAEFSTGKKFLGIISAVAVCIFATVAISKKDRLKTGAINPETIVLPNKMDYSELVTVKSVAVGAIAAIFFTAGSIMIMCSSPYAPRYMDYSELIKH